MLDLSRILTLLRTPLPHLGALLSFVALLGCQTSQSTTKSSAAEDVGKKAAAAPQVQEGLETKPEWRVRDWGNPARYEVIDDPAKSGNRIGRLSFMEADKQKAAISLDPALDFAKVKAITFDIYNGSTQAVQVAVAIKTKPNYDYYESQPIEVRSRKWKKRCEVRLDASAFKTESTNWEHKSAITDIANAYQILFLVYPESPAGHIHLDNVRVVSAE